MQPPTPTKNHRPATKARTFVLANGALLAEQVVTEYEQTNYEILRFVHQDASGSGVQQTLANGTLAIPNGRTAEYDAMGRNVADPGPYVLLNTQVPSENGSGIDLFGNGEGYRPGRSTYKVNGFIVPESTFMMHIGSFTFDLIQVAVRMSTRPVGYWERTVSWNETWGGSTDEFRVETFTQRHSVSFITSFVYDSSWSVIASLIPQTRRDEIRIRDFYDLVPTDGGGTLRFKDKDSFRKLFSSILSKGECEKKLNDLLAEISKLGGINQTVSVASIAELFKNIDSQERGGFYINLEDTDAYEHYKRVNGYGDEVARGNWPAGGGGVTFRNGRNPSERYVYMYARGGWLRDTYNIRKLQQVFAYGDFVRTVHEMFHAATNGASFSHEQMDEAAKRLGGASFKDYVEKYCVPEAYRSREP